MATPQNLTFLVSGYSLADAITGFTFSGETESLDATTVADSGFRTKVAGFKSGQCQVSGIFDADETDADKIHDVFSSAWSDGAVRYVMASAAQVASGVPALMMEGATMKYDIPIDTGALIFSNGTFDATNGIHFGFWLTHAQLDAGTNNGTALDNAAASTNGGYMQAHLINDTATDVDIKIQHSTNNSVWADLTGAAVNNLSADHAAGSATVAPGTTVNRYLRAVATVTGGDTLLISVAFERN